MKKTLLGILLNSWLLQAQVGIGTPTPQETLHVNGSFLVTNSFNVGGNANTKGSPGIAGQVLKSNGPGVAPSWEDLAGGVPNATGTVIAVNGQFLVAQEITVQMSSDFTNGRTSNTAVAIGNLNTKIVDNENTYTGTRTSNSFRVSVDGIYQISMNMQIAASSGNQPMVGVWNNTTGNWITCVNDTFTATAGTSNIQCYTLLASVPMLASSIYSFRVANQNASFTVKHLSSGITGSGPVTQISIKRLR